MLHSVFVEILIVLQDMAPEQPALDKQLTDVVNNQAFENTSTSVAASQMRNALNNLADTVKDPKEKQVRLVHVEFSWLLLL